MIIIKETNIDEALIVNQNVIEFSNEPVPNFAERYNNKNPLIICAYKDDIAVGYIVGYDKFSDGSLYCWMAGVDINYRRMGILTQLMDYQINWAKKNGYNKLKIRTRNNRREMLSFLVKKGFNFTKVEEKEDITENRINLEIDLIDKE